MKFMLGVDEAGRGPLAGPVSVGVVAVSEGFDVALEFPGVADSKAISEKKRELVFSMLEDRVQKGDVRFVVELPSAEDIDREGIAVVIRKAVSRAVNQLAPDAAQVQVLLDGSLKAPMEYAQKTIIGGDATEPIISLASIAAKVTRDRYMVQMAEKYPGYGFEKHKGYGTKAHYEALMELGLSDIHRKSYVHIDFNGN